MKHTLKNMLGIVLFLGVTVFSLSSCYETHYYHHYNHHTQEWYGRHNTPPPAGVDFKVDVRN